MRRWRSSPGRTSVADWGQGPRQVGKRKNVFDGLPYALYLPGRAKFRLRLKRSVKLPNAACRRSSLEPRLGLAGRMLVSSLRGGGNVFATDRDVIPPLFPAIAGGNEVYTPAGIVQLSSS